MKSILKQPLEVLFLKEEFKTLSSKKENEIKVKKNIVTPPLGKQLVK
jgi:hypothetical protein